MKLTNISKLLSEDARARLGGEMSQPAVPRHEQQWVKQLGTLFEQVPLEGGMTEKTINAALDQVATIEGGWSDDPRDPGGKTNHGVTLKFLQSIRPDATEDDLRNLTKEDARGIFRSEFVDKVGIDKLPDRVQAEAIGLSINAGPARAIKALQAAAGVKADGKVGPQTIAALEKLSEAEIKQAVDGYYISLVEKRPDLAPFLRGWLNRSASLASIPEDINA